MDEADGLRLHRLEILRDGAFPGSRDHERSLRRCSVHVGYKDERRSASPSKPHATKCVPAAVTESEGKQ